MMAEQGMSLALAVKGYCARLVAPILVSLSELNRRLAEFPVPANGADGAPGAPGKDGQSVDPAEVLAMVADEVARVVAAIPAPKDGINGEKGIPGDPGRDGQDADSEAIAKMITTEVAVAVAQIPIPLDGRHGEKGDAGRDGRDGKDADQEIIAQLVAGEVLKAVAQISPPKDGLPGERGEPGRDGRDGKDAREPIDGIDGVNGKDGKDGRDALYVDEFAAELLEDGRTLVLKLSSGGKDFTSQIVLAVPLDVGVYKAGVDYNKGDSVSWNGNTWIAQRATTDKPGTSDAFRLAVRKGKDAVDTTLHLPKREPVRLK